MLPNLFTSSPLVWLGLAGLLAALPILVHLINQIRHPTVRWAAMDLLLAAHRRRRSRIWLRQALLLASRILVLLVALAMLSHLGCRDEDQANWWGGQTIHHYVVLDDNFSMEDRTAGTSAMQRAGEVLQLIGARASGSGDHRMTVVRTSRASQIDTAQSAEYTSWLHDLDDQSGGQALQRRLLDLADNLEPSAVSVSPAAAIRWIGQLVADRPRQRSFVYIISDFRAVHWADTDAIEPHLTAVRNAGAQIEFIQCVKQQNPNLAVVELHPSGNIRSESVPFLMQVTLKNFSSESVQNLQVRVSSIEVAAFDGAGLAKDQARTTELPPLLVDHIEPYGEQSRTFPVHFSSPGYYAIRVMLPDDSVLVDNAATCVVQVRRNASVLLIDHPDRANEAFVSLALGPRQLTGLETQTIAPSQLREMNAAQLGQFDAIVLMDPPALDDAALRNLEGYAESGGGVAWFLGPNADPQLYNQIYFREGKGLWPLPLSHVTELADKAETGGNGVAREIAVTDHQLLRALSGTSNSLLQSVQIHRLAVPPAGWSSSMNGAEIAAAVGPDFKQPLIVVNSHGRGRVVAVTTTAGPVWNNWARNPTFPAVLLSIQEYLLQRPQEQLWHVAGADVAVSLPADQFQTAARLEFPSGILASRGDRLIDLPNATHYPDRSVSLQGNTENQFESPKRQAFSPRQSPRVGSSQAIDHELISLAGELAGDRVQFKLYPLMPDQHGFHSPRAGVHHLHLRDATGQTILLPVAVNIDTRGSDLALASRRELLAGLADAQPRWVAYDEFDAHASLGLASSLSAWMLVLMIGLLLSEQLMAYWNSFHPRRRGARA